jgi:hypothetical protein
VSKQGNAKPAAGGHAALFAELEAKGMAAASGLKKVKRNTCNTLLLFSHSLGLKAWQIANSAQIARILRRLPRTK